MCLILHECNFNLSNMLIYYINIKITTQPIALITAIINDGIIETLGERVSFLTKFHIATNDDLATELLIKSIVQNEHIIVKNNNAYIIS